MVLAEIDWTGLGVFVAAFAGALATILRAIGELKQKVVKTQAAVAETQDRAVAIEARVAETQEQVAATQHAVAATKEKVEEITRVVNGDAPSKSSGKQEKKKS